MMTWGETKVSDILWAGNQGGDGVQVNVIMRSCTRDSNPSPTSGSGRRTPAKVTIPWSGPVTSAKAREPVDPAEAREHDDLERWRESILDSTPSPARSTPASGRAYSSS
jgi:hypothetical protein